MDPHLPDPHKNKHASGSVDLHKNATNLQHWLKESAELSSVYCKPGFVRIGKNVFRENEQLLRAIERFCEL